MQHVFVFVIFRDVHVNMELQVESNSLINPENKNNLPTAVANFKKKKHGIIYISYIPRYMTVKKVREYFSEFGEVTRLFLKPEKTKSGKPSKFFREGWVEFSKRRIAKQVADCLNGAQVGGKRHTPFYDSIWCIKYLKKFQWGQISEAKAHEKIRKEQKMQAEIAKVKKEIDVYTRGFEKMKRLKKMNSKLSENDLETKSANVSQISETVEGSPNQNISSAERQSSLLKKVFGTL